MSRYNLNRYLIKQAMREKRFTQTQLRDELKKIDPEGKGVSQPFISMVLKGDKTGVLLKTAKLFSSVLDIDMENLLATPEKQDLYSAFNTQCTQFTNFREHFDVASNSEGRIIALVARTSAGQEFLKEIVEQVSSPNPNGAIGGD